MDVIGRDAALIGTGGGIVTRSVPVPGQVGRGMAGPAALVNPIFFRPLHDVVGDPSEAVSQPSSSSPSILTLGPLMIARIVLGGGLPADEGVTGLLFIPDDRRLTLYDGTVLDACAGDLIALPAGGLLRSIGQRPLTCTALLAPRRFLGAAMPSRSAVVILSRSGSTDALRRHAERLYTIGAGVFDAVQAQAAACSIRELLAAAAVPVAPVRQRGVQREEALLDRILEHVDATLGGEVSIVSLCEHLACSRSALYRAAAPRGGLVELVMRQRLIAVRHALGRREDRRTIAEIARAHGFVDPSQFSRRFRRAFGVSAGQVRAATVNGAADGVLLHPDTARHFALAASAKTEGADGIG